VGRLSADQSPEFIFPIPAAIDASSPDREEMAESITRFWTLGAATVALRPALVKLIKLADEFPTEGALEEEGPESIYVMF
jgi:hypothetical protein